MDSPVPEDRSTPNASIAQPFATSTPEALQHQQGLSTWRNLGLGNTTILFSNLVSGNLQSHLARNEEQISSAVLSSSLASLNTVIPFYSIRQLSRQFFGYDPLKILVVFAVGFGAAKACLTTWKVCLPIFKSWFISSVTIEESDPLYHSIMGWLSKHVVMRKSQHLTAKTPGMASAALHRYHHGPSFDDWAGLYTPERFKSRRTISDEQQQTAQYFPLPESSAYFWHDGRWFRYEATQPPTQKYEGRRIKMITLMCLGRDSRSLKRLLSECEHLKQKASQNTMSIFLRNRQRTMKGNWLQQPCQPIRALSTIDLNQTIKDSVIKELEVYLSPGRNIWYSERGIPYSRGYLLHGPPGTGKTSFSKCIAGHFKLPLYMLDIASKDVDELDMAMLFETLPAKCVVLLEDIDSAGIARENMKADATIGMNGNEPQRVPKKNQQYRSQVTLSGLLNAIDGPVSAQGRILIMTSNSPESLDPALIRPGRVDRQIYFGNVDAEVARSIFKRMFLRSPEERARLAELSRDSDSDDDHVSVASDSNEVERVQQAAEIFASRIPKGEISPAELQGYLLVHQDIDEALAHIAEWCQSTIEAKNTGKNIVEEGNGDEWFAPNPPGMMGPMGMGISHPVMDCMPMPYGPGIIGGPSFH